MKLSEWQDLNKIKNKELADRLNVDPSYITLLRKQRRIPSLQIAIKIQEITGGSVTLQDLNPV